jgi:hypothetical protein
MIIVDPVTLGDVACTRASSKWVFDRSGTMVQVPANALAVTYDPSDLTKAPYALVEPAATNLAVQSEVMSAWQSSAATVQTDIGYAPNGTLTIDRITGSAAVSGLYRFITLNPGEVSCASIFVKWESGDTLLRFGSDQGGTALYAVFDVSAGTVSSLGSGIVAAGVIRCNTPYGIFYRLWVAFAAPLASTPFILYSAAAAMTLQAWGFQVEPGKSPTSYIATTAAGPVTRAGDVIGAGSGLVYSNVAITEPTYSTATTYAKDDKVYDPVTHNVFQSLIASRHDRMDAARRREPLGHAGSVQQHADGQCGRNSAGAVAPGDQPGSLPGQSFRRRGARQRGRFNRRAGVQRNQVAGRIELGG